MNKQSVETEVKAVFIDAHLTDHLKRTLKTFYDLNKDAVFYCSSRCFSNIKKFFADTQPLQIREVEGKNFNLTFKYSDGSLVTRDTSIGHHYDDYAEALLEINTIGQVLSL